MKFLAVLTVLFLVSAQAFAEELGDNEELNYWSDWSDGDQNKEELPLPFEHFLQRIARRPRPQQFYGLMGKRDSGYSPLSHKRHKTDSFVGLMGKRSLDSEPEWLKTMKYKDLIVEMKERWCLSLLEDLLNGTQHRCMKGGVNETFLPIVC